MEAEELVIVFICEITGEKSESLSMSTCLFHDLGMDGADAIEFMEAFSKKFNVDISRFQFSRYFGDEGTMGPLAAIKAILLPSNQAKLPITIGHLAKSVESGFLEDEKL